MVRRETTLQGLLECWYLRAQPSAGKLGQNLGIGGAANERLEHRPPGNAEHAGSHRRELYPGLLEDLLQTLDLPGALFYLHLAVAREVPELPNLLWWYEARTHQPVLYKLADPLGVLD